VLDQFCLVHGDPSFRKVNLAVSKKSVSRMSNEGINKKRCVQFSCRTLLNLGATNVSILFDLLPQGGVF
jgi:hypothetical protein